METIYIK